MIVLNVKKVSQEKVDQEEFDTYVFDNLQTNVVYQFEIPDSRRINYGVHWFERGNSLFHTEDIKSIDGKHYSSTFAKYKIWRS